MRGKNAPLQRIRGRNAPDDHDLPRSDDRDLLRRFLQLGSGRFPQGLDVVVLTLFLSEYVHNHIAVVDKDPLRLRVALDVILLQALSPAVGQQAVSDSLDVRIRVAGADDEVVGDQRAIAQVDDLDLFRLLLGNQFLN